MVGESPDASLVPWLLAWVVIVAVMIGVYWQRVGHGGGLVLAFLMNMIIIHWSGAAVYLQGSPHIYDRATVLAGFRETTWGLVAFCVGCLVLAPLVRSGRTQAAPNSYLVHTSLPRAFTLIGALSFLGLSTSLAQLPTTTAIIAAGQQLFVLGCCLGCWNAWHQAERRKAALWLSLALIAPAATIVLHGFLGYGVAAVVVVGSFASLFLRPRWVVVVVGVVTLYLGLSLFVTYFQQRNVIRAIVNSGAPIQTRFNDSMEKLWPLEMFNWNDPDHLYQLDLRLNQNHLVGSAVKTLSVTREYARGETLKDAALALVPRILWPDKPVAAGSGQLVSKYTGIYFAPGTSVGIGVVMEFYANLGTAGVIAGMLLIGAAVGGLDQAAARRLAQRDMLGFSLLFLVGISFLQVGGSLVEVSASAASSVGLAFFINKILLHRMQRRGTTAPPNASPAMVTAGSP